MRIMIGFLLALLIALPSAAQTMLRGTWQGGGHAVAFKTNASCRSGEPALNKPSPSTGVGPDQGQQDAGATP
jgi:hypothetical protein